MSMQVRDLLEELKRFDPGDRVQVVVVHPGYGDLPVAEGVLEKIEISNGDRYRCKMVVDSDD